MTGQDHSHKASSRKDIPDIPGGVLEPEIAAAKNAIEKARHTLEGVVEKAEETIEETVGAKEVRAS